MTRNDLLTISQRLREYKDNPHHINPMSESFGRLIVDAADALSEVAVDYDAQHSRIVEAKDAEIARLNEGFFRANKDALGVALERDELRAQLAAQQSDAPPCAAAYMTADRRMLIFADKFDSMEWGEREGMVPLYPLEVLAAQPAAVPAGYRVEARDERGIVRRDCLSRMPFDPNLPDAKTWAGEFDVTSTPLYAPAAPQQGDGVNWKAVANEQRLVIEGLQARLNADRSAQGEKP